MNEPPLLHTILTARTPADLLGQMSRLYILSRAIHAAADLGLADLVGDTPISAAEVASRRRLHPGFTGRVMSYLAGHGVFEETSPGHYRATEMSRVMRDDHPRSMRPVLRMVSEPWWRAAGRLTESLETGRSGVELAHDLTFPALLAGDRELQGRFDEGMSAISRNDDAGIAAACDLPRAGLVVDLAGGKGSFLGEILRRNVHLEGVLLEQPPVLAGGTLVDDLVAAGRARLVAGDLHGVLPAAADVYLLKGTLQTFADREVLGILRNCAATLRPGARLLVIEPILPEGPHPARTMDLVMLLLFGAGLRTALRWRALLGEAGLEPGRVLATGTMYTVLEASPLRRT